MKESFPTFALRYVLTLLLGLGCLLAHRIVDGGLLAPLIPQVASAWELSKITFWPLLITAFIGGLTLPKLAEVCTTSLVLVLLNWLVLSLGGDGGLCLVVWMGVLAFMLAWHPLDGASQIPWLLATVAMAMLYILLTFCPLYWGPFLDPTDVAAMAVIPY